MNQRHFNALLAVELTRARPAVTRLGIATLLALGVFWLLGRATPENLVAVTLGAGLGVAVGAVSFSVLRDRLDRTLEFFVALPTTAGTLVAAKFAAAALVPLPWAVATGVVFALAPPLGVRLGDPVGMAAGVLVAAWGALAVLSWVFIAAWARFEPNRAMMLPLALMVLAALMDKFAGSVLRLFGVRDVSAALLRLLEAPWLPLAAALLAAALFAGVGLIAFAITRRALRHYQPTGAEL